ncbi:MAG: hypothetical protein AAFU64_05160 [Bacteroidota bacterium]
MLDQSRYHPDNPILKLLYREGKELSVKSQECVVRVGEQSNKVFLIIKGGFVCQNYDERSDRLRTINFHLDIFHPLMTVLDSYYRDAISNCQLKAFKRSEVLVIPKKAILSALDEAPALKEAYNDETAYALIAMNEYLTHLITLDTKDMYQYLRDECPEILREVPSKYIAEFMGVSPEWLSQIKQQF